MDNLFFVASTEPPGCIFHSLAEARGLSGNIQAIFAAVLSQGDIGAAEGNLEQVAAMLLGVFFVDCFGSI